MTSSQILIGDARRQLKTLPPDSVNCVVTSPPYYGLRDYGIDGQIGLEPSWDQFMARLMGVFAECHRVLRDDGVMWVNTGDVYSSGGRKTRDPGLSKLHMAYEDDAYRDGIRPSDPDGIKPKDLIGQPWRLAFALRDAGWYLRQDIIWHKPNPMPESVTDRCTKAHEYIFMFSKSAHYWSDFDAIKEDSAPSTIERISQNLAAQQGSLRVPDKTNGAMKAVGSDRRNRRSVWTVATESSTYKDHFAVFPLNLVRPCVLAGCPVGGTVLDPFSGTGTTGVAALELNRRYIGIELNPKYAEHSRKRLATVTPELNLVL